MNHTVGTVASGAFILTKLGKPESLIAGYAIGNRLVTGSSPDSANVEPTEEALANALLWAGASDLLEALNYLLAQTVDQDLSHGIELTEGEQDARIKALAAIGRATLASTAKAAA